VIKCWHAILEHPVVRLELQRVRRKRWWPGRRFFLFYPALLGAALGCGITWALGDRLGGQPALLVVGASSMCALNGLISLLGLALSWIAPALTAASIVHERELGTLDLLRATLLTERAIVLGKLGGCVVRLWPAILTLLLLTPFRIVVAAGSGLLSPTLLPALTMDGGFDLGQSWPWLLLAGLLGWLRPWGDLAFHAAVGLFISVPSRSSGTAIAVSYGTILVVRVALWLVTSLLVPLLVALPSLAETAPAPVYVLDAMVWVPALAVLATVFIEVVGAVLLVWGAIRWLKRM